MRQRLLTHRGIGIAQAAIEIGTGACLVEGLGHVLQADGRERQHFGVGVAGRRLGMPQRLEARLLQAPVVQVLQGLQVLAADVDIAAQHVGRGVCRGQAIVCGVQAVVGEHLQLGLQGVAAFVGGPQRHVALLLIERLQAQLGTRVDVRRQPRANTGQLRQGKLHRARRCDGHRYLISCRDQWCNEQANAQVTCVFFEHLA